MSLQDIQEKIVKDIANVVTFNNNIEAKIQAVLASKNQLTTDAEALLQEIQSSSIPVPAAVSSAVASFANEQPAIANFGTKLVGIINAQNQVLNDLSAIIAPATPVTTPAAPTVAASAAAAVPGASAAGSAAVPEKS